MNYKFLIVSISSLVLAIIAASLWAGIAMREVTVVDHPYEEGLKYDWTQKRHIDLGWKVFVPPTLDKDGQLNVTISDKTGAPADVGSVEFAVNRVASSETRSYRALRVDRGSYGARLYCSPGGYWEIRVRVTLGGDTLYYDSRIHIDG